MITASTARDILRALEEKYDRLGLAWHAIAHETLVSERTLLNAVSWARGEGRHRPRARTLRAIAAWLRRRGTFVALR